MKSLSLVLLFSLLSLPAFAQTKVAVVKLLKGDVEVKSLGKTVKLKVEDWVEDGSVVVTAEKSFVKLVFTDKSQMNIGPNSEMKIEKFNGKDSGVIDLVKGKIRSQVTKDYLNMQDKDKSKLFIKTPNAVMGIRGTDFMISTNGTNTAAVLFEGEVVFNRLDQKGELPSNQLEAIVEKGVHMYPGEFSVQEVSRPNPTVPSLLNVQQRESLEKNENFDSERGPSNTDQAKTEQTNSVVPEGLNGAVVSNDSATLKSELSSIGSAPAPETGGAADSAASRTPEGYVMGDTVKPANGSFVHIDSGIIIPPGPGSVLDANTNTYIPGGDSGRASSNGDYVPPKNVEITTDGRILVAVTDSAGTVKVQEVPPPPPVNNAIGSVSLGGVAHQLNTNPTMLPPPGQPVRNDIYGTPFAPTLTDYSNTIRPPTGGATITDSAAANTMSKVNINVTGP